MEMAASESKVHTYMVHLHCIEYVFVPNKRDSKRMARENRREQAAISVSTCMLAARAAPCA